MSCRNHKWKIISIHYVPHNKNVTKFEVGNGDFELVQQVFGNYTVIVQQCEKCGEIKQQKICGKMEWS